MLHSKLELLEEDQLRRAAQQSVLILGLQHPKTVVCCLLGHPLPFDRSAPKCQPQIPVFQPQIPIVQSQSQIPTLHPQMRLQSRNSNPKSQIDPKRRLNPKSSPSPKSQHSKLKSNPNIPPSIPNPAPNPNIPTPNPKSSFSPKSQFYGPNPNFPAPIPKFQSQS